MQSPEVRKQISTSEVVLGLCAATLFAIAGILNQKLEKPVIVLSKDESAININRNALLFFNLGNKRLLADLLWIQTLLESDEEHYNKKDLNSWMYLRFMNISVLDPLFYENYYFGGVYLSIVKNDLVGASEIYDRGLEFYPQDYQLNYNSGFNYYFELEDYQKGLSRLEAIKNHPKAPPFIKSIINKLAFETDKKFESALAFLKQSYQEAKDEGIKSKIAKDIYALQAELDLECLNEKRNDCNTKDVYGNPYILKDRIWRASINFKPYRLTRKEYNYK